MNLGIPYEIVVHYHWTRGMTGFDHQDGFPMMSALVCMVTHWIGPMVNHDINYWVVMSHQATILHGFSTLREY